MFLGSFRPSFNQQSRRIALPKKLRDVLSTNEIVLSLGFEKCIFGFGVGAWEKESKKQLDEPLALRGSRDIRRFFFSGAELVELDNQGRFVIPGSLFGYAQIKEPVIIGAGDHFEIWNRKHWLFYKQKLTRAFKR